MRGPWPRVLEARAPRRVDGCDRAPRGHLAQPYLSRLFGTKKELFLAVNEACFARTLETSRFAASGKSGQEALRAIGEA